MPSCTHDIGKIEVWKPFFSEGCTIVLEGEFGEAWDLGTDKIPEGKIVAFHSGGVVIIELYMPITVPAAAQTIIPDPPGARIEAERTKADKEHRNPFTKVKPIPGCIYPLASFFSGDANSIGDTT